MPLCLFIFCQTYNTPLMAALPTPHACMKGYIPDYAPPPHVSATTAVLPPLAHRASTPQDAMAPRPQAAFFTLPLAPRRLAPRYLSTCHCSRDTTSPGTVLCARDSARPCRAGIRRVHYARIFTLRGAWPRRNPSYRLMAVATATCASRGACRL